VTNIHFASAIRLARNVINVRRYHLQVLTEDAALRGAAGDVIMLFALIHAVLRTLHEVLNIDLAVVAADVMKVCTSPEPPV